MVMLIGLFLVFVNLMVFRATDENLNYILARKNRQCASRYFRTLLKIQVRTWCELKLHLSAKKPTMCKSVFLHSIEV